MEDITTNNNNNHNSNNNIGVLVNAKEEYTKQLISILKTCIYQGIKSIYMDAKDICHQDNTPDNVLMIFKDMEYRGTKFLNPVSTIVADKLKLSVEAKHNNIPIPKTVPIVLPNLGALNKVAEYIIDSVGLPCVIKKTDWGLGIGIVKVNTYNELTDILGMLATMKLTNMYAINNFNYIAQEFIPDNIGSAVRVVVLNNKCIAAIFKKAPHWKSNSK